MNAFLNLLKAEGELTAYKYIQRLSYQMTTSDLIAEVNGKVQELEIIVARLVLAVERKRNEQQITVKETKPNQQKRKTTK